MGKDYSDPEAASRGTGAVARRKINRVALGSSFQQPQLFGYFRLASEGLLFLYCFVFSREDFSPHPFHHVYILTRISSIDSSIIGSI